jgi:hypothetical protein
MMNLADNTKHAIVDAADRYLNQCYNPWPISNDRAIHIVSGTGGNGDPDLSTLKESSWPEDLQYLSQ